MNKQLSNSYYLENIDYFRNKFSRVKLIALDLDGTLLENSDDLNVGKEINQLCTKLYNKYSIYTVITTGRTLTGAKKVKETLIKDLNMPLILYNGSVIIHNNTHSILMQKTIIKEGLTEVVNTIKEHPSIHAFFYSYIDDLFQTYEIVKGWSLSNQRPEFEFNGQKIEWIDSLSQEIENNSKNTSAILLDIKDIESAEKKLLFSKLINLKNVTITSSSKNYVEIRPKNSNKGIALSFLTNYLNISQDNTLSIGDNDNDVEMLEFTDLGICVDTATPSAKKACDFITQGGAYLGVFDIIKKIDEIQSQH